MEYAVVPNDEDINYEIIIDNDNSLTSDNENKVREIEGVEAGNE